MRMTLDDSNQGLRGLLNRRDFLKGAGVMAGVIAGPPGLGGWAADPALDRFKLGVISDELSPDLETALRIMHAKGLKWVELRTVWHKYNTEATPAEVRRIKDLLKQYDFRVSVVDTALFKCDLPGTTNVVGEKPAYPYSEQMDLLKRGIDRAHELGTDKVRVFAFWRVAKPEDYYPRIAEHLSKAAEVAHQASIRLVLEDEGSCNVGCGRELAAMLRLVTASNFGANWDVGNGYWHDEDSYPTGYSVLPKNRIWHMHLKDVRCDAGYRNCRTVIVGTGQVNLLGQLRALLHDHYEGTMSLEPEVEMHGMTHQEATRRSLDGLLKLIDEAVA